MSLHVHPDLSHMYRSLPSCQTPAHPHRYQSQHSEDRIHTRDALCPRYSHAHSCREMNGTIRQRTSRQPYRPPLRRHRRHSCMKYCNGPLQRPLQAHPDQQTPQMHHHFPNKHHGMQHPREAPPQKAAPADRDNPMTTTFQKV